MATRKSSNIPIDGEYLKGFIADSGKTQVEIAASIGRAHSYLANCIARGYMQKPVLELFTKLYPVDVNRLCPPEEPEKPEKPQEAEQMTLENLDMATAIEILLRIEKKLDAIIGKGA